MKFASLISWALLLVLSLAVGATRGHADDKIAVGTATLTVWMDRGDGFPYAIELTQWDDATVTGRNTFPGWPMVNLERDNCGDSCGYKGEVGTGFVDFKCTAAGVCGDTINSAQADLTATPDGKLEGSVNFDPVHALNTQALIRVIVNGTSVQDGGIELRQTRQGHYEGEGAFGNPYFTSFRATLDTEGSFQNMDQDPALFSVFLIAPFARH